MFFRKQKLLCMRTKFSPKVHYIITKIVQKFELLSNKYDFKKIRTCKFWITTNSNLIFDFDFFLYWGTVGILEVRLMGCQDLLEDVPGRSRRDRELSSSPSDLRTFMKGVTGRSSSKSYNVKDEISNEIMAIIKLDNQTVAQTSWRLCSQQAWDQRCTNLSYLYSFKKD